MARLFKTPVTVEGAISTNNVISSTQSFGDEGGQIDLTKAATNTTLTTGVTIDVFQNKLRLFETGNTNRGYYIDISGGAASAGTNLVGGGSGTVTSIVAGTTGLTGGTITTSGTIDIDTTKVPQLTTNTNTFVAGTGATTLVVKQGATQSTTNLFEIQNTSASALAIITSGGSIFSSANGGFGSTSALSTARLSVSAAASSIGLIVRGNATTPGNLQEWQTSTPTTVASVSNTGAVTATTFTSSVAIGTAPFTVTSTTQVANLNVATSGAVLATVTGTNSADLVYGNMADNDQFRIRVGGTATNAGFVEIATADDGTEPIYVRQYTGVFTTLARTATILDGSGNTTFPGTVTGTTFSGSGASLTNIPAANVTGTLTSTVLGNSAVFIGTTSVALNRTTASLALTGISSVTLPGSTSGTAQIIPTAVAGTGTVITLPATTGTVALTANKLSVFAATTSSELLGVISDETGSGALVFGTTPTITPADAVAATSATTAGFMGMPQNAKTASYTLVAADAGKHIYFSGSTASQTLTIPANSSVAFQIGTTITFINLATVSVSIAITTDTMYLAGAGTTGTRTLAANGMATAVKVTATSWIISGNGLT